MPKIKLLQTSFNQGVLSPEMHGRTDLSQYYSGASVLDNGIVMPQGGVAKRYGFKHLRAIEGLDTGDIVKLMHMTVSPTEGYLICMVMDGTGLALNTATGDSYHIPLHPSAPRGTFIKDIQYVQSSGDIVYVHPLFTPMALSREYGVDGSIYFKHEPFTISNPSTEPWYTNESSLKPLLHDTVIKFDMEVGDTFMMATSGDVTGHSQLITYNVRTIPFGEDTLSGAFIGDDATALLNQLVTEMGSTQTFTAIYDDTNKIIKRKNADGDIETVSVISRKFNGIRAVAKYNNTLFYCKSLSSGMVSIVPHPQSGTPLVTPVEEASWSSKRGYPATVIIHGSRLIFGGSYSKPQTLYMSKLGIFGDFKITQEKDSDGNDLPPLATDPVRLTISTKQNTPITALHSSRRLLVFTATSTHSIQGSGDTVDVITPTNASSQLTSTYGSRLVQPEELNGYVYYLQYAGSSLNSTTYEFSRDTYQTSQAALFSAHLLIDPLDVTTVIGSSKFNTTYLAVLNSDGTIAYYSSLLEQDLQNWTRFTTEGKFIAIQGIEDKLYVVTRRQGKVQVEVMDNSNVYCDMAKTVNLDSGTILDGLAGYSNQPIAIVADGYPLTVKVGEGLDYVELPFPANDVTYGLPIDFNITTMPLNANLQSGAIVNSRKRVTKAKVHLMDSLDVSIGYCGNTYKIVDLPMDFFMDTPPESLSGTFTKSLIGWSTDARLSITSKEAVPVTVITLEAKITVTE